jgi:GIY-YIG catalytic domain
MIYIYGLYNSKEQVTDIRYIGQAQTPTLRLSGHRNSKDGTQRSQWIHAVQDSGGTIAMVILDSAEDKAQAHIKENAWILFGKSLGWQLVNGTDPGEHRSLLAPQFAQVQNAAQVIDDLHNALDAERNELIAERSKLQAKHHEVVLQKESTELATLEANVLADRMHDLESMLMRVNIEKDAMLQRWYRAYLLTTLLLLAGLFSTMLLMDFRMGDDTSLLGRIEAYTILFADVFMPFCFAFIGWFWFGQLPFHRLSILNEGKGLRDWEKSLDAGQMIYWESVKVTIKFTAINAIVVIAGLVANVWL